METETLTTDYTAEQLTQLEKIKNDLTKQRDDLATAIRKRMAGEYDEKAMLATIQPIRAAISKAYSNLPTLQENAVIDITAGELLESYWETARQRKNTAATGFSKLNDVLSGGFEPGRLVGILAPPNVGKTTLIHQISDTMADSGRPVLYVTSEDTPSTLLAKTLSRIGQVKYTAVLQGWPTEEDRIKAAISQQRLRMSSQRLRYLDATNDVTLDLIKEIAQKHFALYADLEHKGGPGIIVIDYLQRIARAIKRKLKLSQELREVVTMVSEELRDMAIKLNCTVIAITAQHRTGYQSGNAGAISSAKESGDIEYTCDVMITLNEVDEKKRCAPIGQVAIDLYVAKNRQGHRERTIALNFWPDRQCFTQDSSEDE